MSNVANISLFALLYIVSVLDYSICLRWDGQQLFDLEGTGGIFINQANLWSASKLGNDSIYYACGGTYLLGGPGVLGLYGSDYTGGEYFQRLYTSLPSHNMIIVSLTFFKIDSWDPNEDDFVQFVFNSTSLNSWKLSSFQPYEQDLCGASFPDYPDIKIFMLVPHVGSTLNMKVVSHLNQDAKDESFGFREIKMIFINSPSPQLTFCGVSNSPLPDQICPCSSPDQYKDPLGGNCQACNSKCALCNGPNANNCTSCHVGKYLNDQNECVNCSTNCAECQGTATHCLRCPPDWFFVNNNTCIPACDPPLIQTSDGTHKFCESPCNSNQLIYPNGSCHSICDPLLQQEAIATFNLCKIPCGPNQVLYYNKSCSLGCNLPFHLRNYGSYNVCDYICLTTEYLYPNGTCQLTCNLPFKPLIQGNKRFCQTFCHQSQYFLSIDKKCLEFCPPHFYTIDNLKRCERCNDDFCLSCSVDGQVCNQCEEKTVLDIDRKCKVCSSLKVDYMGTINNNGHQYSLQLFPSSCNIDAEIIERYLSVTNESKKFFPQYSLQVKKADKNLYILTIIFEGSILKKSFLDFEFFNLNGSLVVPKTFLPDPSIQKLAEYTPTAGTFLTAMTGVSAGGAFALGATVILWSMINFQQFIGYYIYINIDYPLQVELFLSIFSFANFDFLPNILSPITKDFEHEMLNNITSKDLKAHEPPKKFRKFNEVSFFVENGGTTLVLNLALLVVLCVASFMIKFYRRRHLPFLKATYSSFRWNLIMRTFMENGIPLSLATFLQLRKLSFQYSYTSICGILAIISFFYLILMAQFFIKSMLGRSSRNLRMKQVRQLYGTLYNGMLVENQLTKYYQLFLMLRGMLLAFLVVFFENNPLLQIIPPILMNLFLISLLFKEKAFEDSKLDFINKLKEILILAAEICIMLLYFDSASEIYYQVLGWLIIGLLGFAVIIELTYIVCVQIIKLKAMMSHIKLLYTIMNLDLFKSKKRRNTKNEPRTTRSSTLSRLASMLTD